MSNEDLCETRIIFDMTPVDPDAIKREIAPFLPLREVQITAFTDSVLLRDTDTDVCGLPSACSTSNLQPKPLILTHEKHLPHVSNDQ